MQKTADISKLKNRKKEIKHRKYKGYYLYPQIDNNIFETDTGYINGYSMTKEKYSIREFIKSQCKSDKQKQNFRKNIKNIIRVIRQGVNQNLSNNGFDKIYRIHKIVPDFEWYHENRPVSGAAINFSVFIENTMLSTEEIKFYILCSFLYDETEFKEQLNITESSGNILYDNLYINDINRLDKGILFAASEILFDLKVENLNESELSQNDYLKILGVVTYDTKNIFNAITTTTIKEDKLTLNLKNLLSTKYLIEVYSPFSHSVVQSDDDIEKDEKSGFLIEKKDLILDTSILSNYDVDIYNFFNNDQDKTIIDTHHINFSLEEMVINKGDTKIYSNNVISVSNDIVKFLFFDIKKEDFIQIICTAYILASSFMKETMNANPDDLYHNYVLYNCFH